MYVWAMFFQIYICLRVIVKGVIVTEVIVKGVNVREVIGRKGDCPGVTVLVP